MIYVVLANQKNHMAVYLQGFMQMKQYGKNLKVIQSNWKTL